MYLYENEVNQFSGNDDEVEGYFDCINKIEDYDHNQL